jgi:hypothetical protein
MRAVRWSDNDRYLGPLTYARDHRWKPIAIILASGKGADADFDEGRLTTLRMSAFGHTLILALPAWLIKPDKRWVDTSHYEWSRGPGSGYWDYNRREFGFMVSEGHLSVHYGRATNDSRTEKRWGYFLPWRSWRHVRRSFYGLAGEHVATIRDRPWKGMPTSDRFARFEEEQAIADAVPCAELSFRDFDGEVLTAKTRIEEREWRLGEGRFKWLSLFRQPKIRRSLDIRFSGETGRRKGSWKGGTIGTSIAMEPGELHVSAFMRYCDENSMSFIGVHSAGT